MDLSTERRDDMTSEQKTEIMLHSIENALIAKMAEATNCQPFQMKNMISRCDELKEYFYEMRSELIKGLADDMAA